MTVLRGKAAREASPAHQQGYVAGCELAAPECGLYLLTLSSCETCMDTLMTEFNRVSCTVASPGQTGVEPASPEPSSSETNGFPSTIMSCSWHVQGEQQLVRLPCLIMGD